MTEKTANKTLYDEIFNNTKAPQTTNNENYQEIKDAIDNKKFNEQDMVDLEDIFVIDDKNKETEDANLATDSQAKHNNTEDIKLEDSKYYDLINNTLVDLRLNLEDVEQETKELENINLDNLIKKKEEITSENITVDNKEATNPKSETTSNNFVSNKKDQLEVTAVSKEPAKKSSFFWLNYALVVVLIVISIIGSLNLLLK